MAQHLTGKEFVGEEALEDHWMNTIDDCNILLRDYFRMNLYLAQKDLKMKITLKAMEKDRQRYHGSLIQQG